MTIAVPSLTDCFSTHAQHVFPFPPPRDSSVRIFYLRLTNPAIPSRFVSLTCTADAGSAQREEEDRRESPHGISFFPPYLSNRPQPTPFPESKWQVMVFVIAPLGPYYYCPAPNITVPASTAQKGEDILTSFSIKVHFFYISFWNFYFARSIWSLLQVVGEAGGREEE